VVKAIIKMNEKERNELSGIILDASIEVHRKLGASLLESIYEVCLCKKLELRSIDYKRQVALPINYKSFKLNIDYRIDIIVEDEIMVELKAVEKLLPIHEAQLLTYLKLTKKRLGLLINFNTPRLVQGFKRIIYVYE